MLLAVQGYNNPTSYFKTELFIVSAMIAWTYLLLAYYETKDIDLIDRDPKGKPRRTHQGQEKYLSLSRLIEKEKCPLHDAEKANIKYLLGLRHEIEHRGGSNIDTAVSAKIQACALNFNDVLRRIFGQRCGLDQDLSLAIQFAKLDPVQRALLAGARRLPPAIESYNLAFESDLPKEVLQSDAYAFRVAIVPHRVHTAGEADAVVRIVDPASAEGKEGLVILDNTKTLKFKPKHIVTQMKREGFRKFNMHAFITFWKKGNLKRPEAKLGAYVAGQWVWDEEMMDEARKHCQEQGDRYR